jgi:hypothetical protein
MGNVSPVEISGRDQRARGLPVVCGFVEMKTVPTGWRGGEMKAKRYGET